MQKGTVRESQEKASLMPVPLRDMLRTVVPDVAELLPEDLPYAQFRAALWLELSGNPKLAQCSPASLRRAVIQAAQSGLMPGRDGHFIPYAGECVHVPNYQGLLRCLYRTNRIATAFAEVVYSNDGFTLDYGRAEPLEHVIARSRRGSRQGAYGLIRFLDTPRPLVHYMDADDLERVKRHSRGAEQGAWVSDPDEMCRKSAMKNCMKYAPLPPAAQQLLVEDATQPLLAPVSAAVARDHIVNLFGAPEGTPQDPEAPSEALAPAPAE